MTIGVKNMANNGNNSTGFLVLPGGHNAEITYAVYAVPCTINTSRIVGHT